ncbi:MAG: antitoxin Xre-like helix-turn-helix domain-containing protein [Vicinamibacterales bacterium]
MPQPSSARRPAALSDGAVVTKAVLRAAGLLQVPQKTLSRVIGVSEATVSRMSAGTYTLSPQDKAFELAVLFVRLFRALDAISGGDDTVARTWLRNANAALGDAPITRIESVTGLVDALAYLDARRALV